MFCGFQAAELQQWRARVSLANFVQVFAFYNAFQMMGEKAWVGRVVRLVLKLLRDGSTEVREAAMPVLSGMFHCGFMQEDVDQMLVSAVTWCQK